MLCVGMCSIKNVNVRRKKNCVGGGGGVKISLEFRALAPPPPPQLTRR